MELQKSVKIIHITERNYFLSSISITFHGRDIFAPVAAYISIGYGIAQMGIDVKNLVNLPIPRPIMEGGVLRGQVIRVDNFGNLITNIRQVEVEKFLRSASSRITIGNVIIHEIRRIYTDVIRGESLALYGSSVYLEIAVHAGKASELPEFSPNTIIGFEVTVERSAK
ncbi:MAG TPA: hypothetical protein ENO00_09875 [Deltaproteobacteria bacterium]|nr:hypothetical protein [Deltaproteobacteria bacterium]